jgi:sulfate permease, SulP family
VSPALVLRMRGRTTLGATSLTVLANYARGLDAVGGRLYLAGLDPSLIDQARRTGAIPENAPVLLYGADAVVGESSLEAFHDAQAWADAQGDAPS